MRKVLSIPGNKRGSGRGRYIYRLGKAQGTSPSLFNIWRTGGTGEVLFTEWLSGLGLGVKETPRFLMKHPQSLYSDVSGLGRSNWLLNGKKLDGRVSVRGMA